MTGSQSPWALIFLTCTLFSKVIFLWSFSGSASLLQGMATLAMHSCIPGSPWHAVAGGSKTGCCFCLCLCFLFGRRWVCSLVVFWCCSCWLFSVWIVALVTSSAISFCMIHTWCFSHLFFAHLFGLFCAPTAAFAWCVGTRTLFMKKRTLFAFRAVSFVKLPTILLGPIWCTTATRWMLSAFLFFFCWRTCLFFWAFLDIWMITLYPAIGRIRQMSVKNRYVRDIPYKALLAVKFPIFHCFMLLLLCWDLVKMNSYKHTKDDRTYLICHAAWRHCDLARASFFCGKKGSKGEKDIILEKTSCSLYIKYIYIYNIYIFSCGLYASP